ncbi:hypothetical protein GQ43DRAFT_444331 [Delitschia confertaspora ATCC 74209]|uniref:Uncharacterized protein n=1 Tax=Delitschia confertaspora ATCC 74209 TaxID=1513339 RepID=A0A9P4MLQ0_9PLEO|nr:hypothetical protein GQ43DRAFT_444331 [Delitschia confertaspora ATCC 74209]
MGHQTPEHDDYSTFNTSPSNVNNASISVRDYILYLPYPMPRDGPVPYSTHIPSDPLDYGSPGEPTSTLVLTSPRNTFVDLRILKTVPNTGPQTPNGGPINMLDWGFSGCSWSEPKRVVGLFGSGKGPDGQRRKIKGRFGDGNPAGVAIRHAHWSHWVDSRVAVGAVAPVDEGDLWPMDDGRELEVGHAKNPFTGKEVNHEEMWRNVAILPCGPTQHKIYTVLRIQNDTLLTRGVVIRIGQFCQGILKVGQQVCVERWEYMASNEVKDGLCSTMQAGQDGVNGIPPTAHAGQDGVYSTVSAAQNGINTGPTHQAPPAPSSQLGEWTRTVRLGDMFLPCAVAMKVGEPGIESRVGDVVTYGDLRWVVEECGGWM